MLIRWSRLRPPLERIPQNGVRKLSSPYIFVAAVQLHVFTLSRLVVNCPKTSRHLLSAWCRWDEHPLPLDLCMHTRSFATSSFPSSFLTTTGGPWPGCSKNVCVLFIYLFIFSILIFYELFNLITMSKNGVSRMKLVRLYFWNSWEYEVTPLLPLFPGFLWLRIGVTNRVLSMSLINLSENY